MSTRELQMTQSDFFSWNMEQDPVLPLHVSFVAAVLDVPVAELHQACR
jgi:hypothetical protein